MINTIFYFPENLTFEEYKNLFNSGEISKNTIVFAKEQKSIYMGGNDYTEKTDLNELFTAIDIHISNAIISKIADGAVTFTKLSIDALEGIRTWLKENTELDPEPPVTTFTVYYGFANTDTIENTTNLESREVNSVLGEYDATNESDGNQFYMVLPSNIILENGQLKIKDNPFYFPTRVDTTLEIDGKSYTRYITNGDDLGYKAGFYPFVIE